MSSQQNFNFAVPRKCYATNKVLHSKDRASVQIQISDNNLNRGENTKPLTVALSGFIRSKGRSDEALNRFLKENGVLSFC